MVPILDRLSNAAVVKLLLACLLGLALLSPG